MTMRLKLLATDIKSALINWWYASKPVIIFLGYTAGIITATVYVVIFTANHYNPSNIGTAIVKGYWWIPLSLLILTTAIALPYTDIWNATVIQYWSTRKTLTWWYVKYFMPVSEAPLYINHDDKRVKEFAIQLLRESK